MSRTPFASAVIDATERRDRLRLIRSKNIGPITYRQLMDHFGSAANALSGAVELAKRGGRRMNLADTGDVEQEMNAAEEMGAVFISLGEPEYPVPLAAIDDAPPVICVMGTAESLSHRAIAIVGARNASVSGRKVAMGLAAGLSQAGFFLISGLARGIDTAVHRGSIETGTIAVLAGGLDRTYPPENGPLAEDIVRQGGALISEMPLGWQARG